MEGEGIFYFVSEACKRKYKHSNAKANAIAIANAKAIALYFKASKENETIFLRCFK